jgi:3-deoxy-D-manno-octulosonic-acid transferase
MPFLYDVALMLGLLLISPYLLPKVIFGRHGLKERLGLRPNGRTEGETGQPSIWVHAASVGEVHSLAAFLPALQSTFPQHRFILSVTTKAGKERAAELKGKIGLIFYLPVDLTFSVNRTLKTTHPEILVLTETELWPNLILRAHQKGVKVALVNGRLSPGSFSRYRAFSKTMARVLASIDLFCVQTDADARRFRSLGAPGNKVIVTGNFKGDLLMVSNVRGRRVPVRDALGIEPETRLLVAGSTRPGEEEMLLDALWALKQKARPFRAIVAPRHTKRAGKVVRLLQTEGFVVERFSRLETNGGHPWEILVVDNLGELMRLYSAADVAFVGGSLLPYGGHNPLEPASYGIPVLFGPHMEHCCQSASLLLDSEGGIRVENGGELKKNLLWLFENDEERHRRGARALHAVQKSVGAAHRTSEALRGAIL